MIKKALIWFRLLLAERAVDRPFDAARSMEIDRLVIEEEELR